MRADTPLPAEEELYDRYLDACLSGKVEDPARYCTQHGGSDELLARLAPVHGMVQPTEASADLHSADGENRSSGKLERSLHWTFDATAGRLLSLSMEQDTDGPSTVPQGEMRIRQRTVVEWTPRPS